MKPFSFIQALLFLVFGLTVGYFIFSKTPETELPRPSGMPKIEMAREKLQALTDTDIADYYRLKTLEERYKKADEILGKIMTIFLADLGVRVSKSTLEQAKRGIEMPTTVAQQNISDSRLRQEVIAVKPSVAGWVAAEKSREDVRSDRDISDFLEKVKIDNLADAIRASSQFRNKTASLEELTGHFLGVADVTMDDKGHRWDLELFLNAEMVEGELKGSMQMKMSENGKVFSNKRDRGVISSYREFTSGSDAVLLRVAPTTYFQLYFLKDPSALVGNIYKRKSDDHPFIHIGTLNLRRSR